MANTTVTPSIEEASAKMQEELFPAKNTVRNKLKRWMKYCLWTAICASVVGASRLGDTFSSVEADSGRFVASLEVFFILLLLGMLLGTLFWIAGVLLTKVLKSPPQQISSRYVLGLFVTVVLLSTVGNLMTLIAVLLYQFAQFVFKKVTLYKGRRV